MKKERYYLEMFLSISYLYTNVLFLNSLARKNYISLVSYCIGKNKTKIVQETHFMV